MRVGIIDFGAGASQHTGKRPKNSLGQGCHIVRHCCETAGFPVVDLHLGWQQVDVLMVGLYWWEHLYDLTLMLARQGIEPRRERRARRPVLFVGGQLPSYNPGPVAPFADLVCMGDGEDVAPRVLALLDKGVPLAECAQVPGVYVSELDNRAEWQHVDDISGTVRWPYRNMVRTGDREEVFERRLEIARGCRRKCAFCGLGWTKRYRELPSEVVTSEVKSTPGCVKAFAPNPAEHSGWKAICEGYQAAGKMNQARDISTRTILAEGFGTSHVYSTGIDGLSERLRQAIGKPLTRPELREVIERASAHMGSLGVYQILDLPGETRLDYEEWFSTLKEARLCSMRPTSGRYHGPPGGFFILATLNAFCPTPHTPLQWEGITLRPSCKDRHDGPREILGRMEDRKLRYKVLGRSHGALARCLEAVAVRGEPTLGPLVLALAANRSRLRWSGQVRQLAEHLGVAEAFERTIGPRPTDEQLPWERRVVSPFPRETLLKAWERYHRALASPSAL